MEQEIKPKKEIDFELLQKARGFNKKQKHIKVKTL